MSFFSEFIKHPGLVGAVFPSSRWLSRKIVSQIDFEDCECIVEYGAGTGVFSRDLLLKKKAETKLILIEKHPDFYEQLQKYFENEESVFVINGGAECIAEYLDELNIYNVNYIVSGLPFTAFPEELRKQIFHETQKTMNEDSKFILFQYSTFVKKQLEEYFELSEKLFVLPNFPPAIVFVCEIKQLIQQ